jgi:3D (Asp-Asp-Asp) domain-containing protein
MAPKSSITRAKQAGVLADNTPSTAVTMEPSPVVAQANNTAKATATKNAAQAAAVSANTIDIDGKSYRFSDMFTVKASAYTAAPEENGPWGAVDYFGEALKLGTIAVDPTLIPMNTKVYITGYSYDGLPVGGILATARDQGTSIKGKRIDIFVADSAALAMKFGMQNVQVYILE